MSGFCAVPRSTGWSGVSARARWLAIAVSSIIAASIVSSSVAIFAISWDVRNPSKNDRNGIRARSVAACATQARSCASWTLPAHSIAKPVDRHVMTSEWSPKIDSACVAIVRAETCMTNGDSSPAILNMFGIISRRPCEAVNVVASAPAWSAPWTAPAAPPSDCISATCGTVPQRFGVSLVAHSSACSPIEDDGVIG